MRNESDLAGVKSVAKMLLLTKVVKTDFSPMVVQHPFTNTGIVGIPSESGAPLEILDITVERKNLSRWRAIIEKQIDNASDPFQIYMMINPPYGLSFLKYAEPYLSQEDYTHILGSAWVMCEAPHNDPDLGVSKLIAMFQKADPALLMDEGEYATYQAMEDTVTVYRGVTPHNAKNIRALSWTTNRETAEWFAHRFGEEGTVYEAQIDKAHIFAYLTASAEHGNQYAAQLLHSIHANQNWAAGMGAIRLLQHISKIIQDRLEDGQKGRSSAVDRKLKRKIDEKKQAHGLKQG